MWSLLRRAVGVGSAMGVSFAFAVGVGFTTSAALPTGPSPKKLRVGDLGQFVTDQPGSSAPVNGSSDFRTSHRLPYEPSLFSMFADRKRLAHDL